MGKGKMFFSPQALPKGDLASWVGDWVVTRIKCPKSDGRGLVLMEKLKEKLCVCGIGWCCPFPDVPRDWEPRAGPQSTRSLCAGWTPCSGEGGEQGCPTLLKTLFIFSASQAVNPLVMQHLGMP